MRSAVAFCLSLWGLSLGVSVCAIGSVAHADEHAQPQTLPAGLVQTLEAFARSPGLHARFTERKSMALLAVPLRSEGEIFFLPPDLFARHTHTPEKGMLVMDGERIRIGDGQGGQTIELRDKPLVRELAGSLSGVLRGDAAGLARSYSLEWIEPKTPQDRWRLVLRPRTPPMRGFIDRLELYGRGAELLETRLVEVGGDETVTQYTAIDTRHSFSADERRRIFGTGGP